VVTRIQIARPPVSSPQGHWLSRASRALLERRLPYQARISLDRICNALGLKCKTIRAEGFRLRVRRQTCDEQFVHTVILNREYNPPGYEIAASDTVVDIGGNIGTFAVLAARHAVNGRVISYEPDCDNYALLCQNLRMNKAANVLAVNAAVGGNSGTRKLFRAAQGGFHTIIPEQARGTAAPALVRVLTLKEVFDTNDVVRCNFLKLDCEGAEYEILFSLPEAYFARIDKIALEYHGPTLEIARERSAALAEHVEKMGLAVTYEEYNGLGCGHIRAQRTV
jgi:FkbM family methyltransferase